MPGEMGGLLLPKFEWLGNLIAGCFPSLSPHGRAQSQFRFNEALIAQSHKIRRNAEQTSRSDEAIYLEWKVDFDLSSTSGNIVG